MASNNIQRDSGGVGFFGLLTILFISLKLTHYIDWSWWWVLSPIWLPLCILSVLALIVFIIYFILSGLNLVK